jgi:drug/metabolite transporter (DMT)-like permease
MGDLGVRLVSFFALVGMQTIAALTFKLSQNDAHYAYSPSSAQTTAEVIKLLISATLFTRVVHAERADAERADVELGQGSRAALAGLVWARFRQDFSPRLALYLGGLAVLYCFNNQLAFRVFRLADAATVTLVKSASTAVSAALLWLLLARPVSNQQLIAIALQSLGLFVAQYDACKQATILPLYEYLLLLLSLLITSVSGVANEKLLKGERAHMHVQNVCLYVYGVVLNLAVFLATASEPFFHGYSLPVWGVIACQALLGVVVTFVLKYADMTVRCLASSCAVSTLYAINIFAFGFEFNPVYFAGAATVFLSTYLYFSVTPLPAANQLEASKQPEAAPAIQPGSVRFPEISLSGCVPTHPSAGVLGLLVVLAVVLYTEVPSTDGLR